MGIGGTIGGVLGLGNPFAIAGGASIGKGGRYPVCIWWR